MCAKKSGEETPAASSRRLRSFQAGWVLRYSRGVPVSSYQPTPKPSPFVVVAPRREWRLWSISERSRLTSSSSRRIGEPEYASQRHIALGLLRYRNRVCRHGCGGGEIGRAWLLRFVTP